MTLRRNRIKRLIGCLILIIVLIAFGPPLLALLTLGFVEIFSPVMQSARATQSVLTVTESALTAAYGTEAHSAVEAFIAKNWSIEAYREPEILAEVATGEILKDLQAIHSDRSTQTIFVNRSSTIDKLQVIEHSATQFKAFSCEELGFDTLSLDGTNRASEKPFTAWKIYLFKRENGIWKLAAWVDFTDVDHIDRDWQYVPQWEKDLIGDLPELINEYDPC